MCGRYVSASSPDAIAAYFHAVAPDVSLPASWNVAPTNEVYVVVGGTDARRVEVVQWGLVPSWAKEAKTAQKMINARAESVASKPAYRAAFTRRRCIVPMDGFYEWQIVPGQKAKQPWFIHRADDEPMAVAGLWERWTDPSDGSVLHSMAVITTAASPWMAPIHDRMPALLPATAWEQWLDPDGHDVTTLSGLLVPTPAGVLTRHPVGPAVGNVRSKGPELVAPAADPAGGRLL